MCNHSQDHFIASSEQSMPILQEEESSPILARRPLAKNTSPSPSDDVSTRTSTTNLPMSLRVLFAFNGFSLAVPTMALLYVVNTRVELPLALLPTYGAIAFLPSSLRPLYAYLSQTPHRHVQLAALLITSAAAMAATAWIPPHGVIMCVVLGFLRGLASAWPEFLLGLTLVDLARVDDSFDTTCAVFQAQAATARHTGSVVASAAALALVSTTERLDAGIMSALLYAAAAANVVAAVVAWYYQVGRQSVVSTPRSPLTTTTNYQSVLSTQDEELGSFISATPPLWCHGAANHNLRLVVLLQITAVLLALQQPMERVLSHVGWQALTVASLVALLLAFGTAIRSGHWRRPQKVGLFLILRHVTPSVGYLLSSYFYDMFATAPYLLQLLSVTDMVVSAGAAWTYGNFWAPFSSDAALPLLIVGLTLLASILSLMQVWLVHVLPDFTDTPMVQFALVLAVTGVVQWTSMWNFMPDVVLATTSVKHATKGSSSASLLALDSSETTTQVAHEPQTNHGNHHVYDEESAQERHARNMQYGTLISCIDFGDQLGALVLSALVAAFDVSRENNWEHLDDLIQSCGILGAVSAVFVLILK